MKKRRIPTRISRTLTSALVLLTLSACGVRSQSESRTIDHGDIPFGLAQPPASSAPTSTTHPQGDSFTLYFVEDDRLVLVRRNTVAAATPTVVLRALAHGPKEPEAVGGLRTLLDPSITVERVSVHDGLAVVELGGDVGAFKPGTEQSLALAQLVYTATALPGVDRIQVRLGGEVAEIPRGNGTLTRKPVGRSDYPPQG